MIFIPPDIKYVGNNTTFSHQVNKQNWYFLKNDIFAVRQNRVWIKEIAPNTQHIAIHKDADQHVEVFQSLVYRQRF